jgi:hypothetical protein
MTIPYRSSVPLPGERADALQEWLDNTQVPPTVRELVEEEIRRLRAAATPSTGGPTNGTDD